MKDEAAVPIIPAHVHPAFWREPSDYYWTLCVKMLRAVPRNAMNHTTPLYRLSAAAAHFTNG